MVRATLNLPLDANLEFFKLKHINAENEESSDKDKPVWDELKRQRIAWRFNSTCSTST